MLLAVESPMMAHEIIDCKLQIRSYVLVPLPSRWIRSGERVIIHSPVQDISTSPENIPAKRYCHGEEQHAVCFMKPSDIEKETSVIYEELCISPSLSWVNAHGVALRSSSCSSPFKYQRGDRFWIHIGSNTNGFDSSVPVINLQTFESGVIAVDHVCWYPHLRGANEELYTLGGDVRKLKQCGSRKFSYWSWVICQSLNSTPSTTKSIEVPAEGARLKDRWPLALEESQDLFEKKCRYMEQCLRGPTERSVWLTPPPTFPTRWEASTPGVKRKGYEQARRTPSAGPTPPKTPPTPRKECAEGQWKSIQYGRDCRIQSATPDQPSTPLTPGKELSGPQVKRKHSGGEHKRIWRGIFELAGRTKGPHKAPTTEIVPSTPHVPSSSQLFISEESSSSTSEDSDSDIEFEFDDDISPFSDIEISPSPSDQKLTAEVADSALSLLDMKRDERSAVEGGFNKEFDPQEEYCLDPIVPSRYARNCNLNDSDCGYIFQSICQHFHVPPSKCIVTAPASDHSLPIHEHCISRLRPYPGQAGPCMLSDKSAKKHTCCRWQEEDKAEWPRTIVQDYERGRIEKEKAMRLQLRDRSRWINRKEQFLPEVLTKFKEFGYEGCRWLVATLERDGYNAEIMDMGILQPSQDEKESTIDDFLLSTQTTKSI